MILTLLTLMFGDPSSNSNSSIKLTQALLRHLLLAIR